MSTITPDKIEAITGKFSFRCTPLHKGALVPDANNWLHYAFRVSLAFGNGKQYSTTYKMGSAMIGSLKVQDVLHSLLTDADGTEQPFEDWAADLGYDSDSIKAHTIYRACVRCGNWLRASLNPDQINQLRELFQDY